MREWLTSWRFLVSRRWFGFFLVVLLLGVGTWWLGEWQFGRLDDKQERNAVIEANAHEDPVPVGEVLAVGEPVAPQEEYTVVEATGTYDVAETLIVRYRTRDSAPGVDVVVPLVLEDGSTLVVDRGWLAYDGRMADAADAAPPPPAGEVTVTGWVRVDGEGDSTRVSDGGMRAISSVEVGEALDKEVLGGFVELLTEDPESATALEPFEEPDTGEGPHFFYGLQWWFFGILAFGGFGYLAWDERKNGPRGERRRRGTTED
ncbi:SURF1 family cytochrome oxidase biogenesis protein [Nocardioides stalactiti]|uniref:SURF1 family cytochrome oxidase biogenesis protein n=1 Tax=Nocardioides stalactiti TaxID=2755356 RepID=UPI00160437E8|nr:SURF1 family protein [Nocardioides stalactiti]